MQLLSRTSEVLVKRTFLCLTKRVIFPSRNAQHERNILSYTSYSTGKDTLQNFEEVSVPIPYGTIKGKAWGNSSNYPVLALHGWLDNCGTFDRLMPLLSNKFYIVAIDAPGHGLSSHKPPGCFYTDISMIMDFKKVTNHFGWKKFGIIGHSMGGALALMFASLYSELIHKLIILDIVKPSSRNLSKFPGEIRSAINSYFYTEAKLAKSPPIYTPETADKRLQEGMFNEVNLEGVRILNKRGTIPSACGKGVIFSRDLKAIPIEQFSRRSHEFIKQFMSAIKCELLMVMANNTHPNYATSSPEVTDSFCEIYAKNCSKFILQKVDGNHFVHLNHPERIAPMINKFLLDNS